MLHLAVALIKVPLAFNASSKKMHIHLEKMQKCIANAIILKGKVQLDQWMSV
jgi:hypothetical protein